MKSPARDKKGRVSTTAKRTMLMADPYDEYDQLGVKNAALTY
jgi:hypothetical protein